MQSAMEKAGNWMKEISQHKSDQQGTDNELEFDEQCAGNHNNSKRDDKFCIRPPGGRGVILCLSHGSLSAIFILSKIRDFTILFYNIKKTPREAGSRGATGQSLTATQEREEGTPKKVIIYVHKETYTKTDKQQNTASNQEGGYIRLLRCWCGRITGGSRSIRRSRSWGWWRRDPSRFTRGHGGPRIHIDRVVHQYDLLSKGNNISRFQNHWPRKALTIYKSAVGRAKVFDYIFPTLKTKTRVLARNFGVVYRNTI